MKPFYRIQSKNSPCYGPYQTYDRCSSISSIIAAKTRINPYSYDRCPAPPFDFSSSLCYRYGFSSLTALKKWFGTSLKLIEILEANQMHIVKFEVSERFDSHKQSIVDDVEMGEIIEIVPFEKINKNYSKELDTANS